MLGYPNMHKIRHERPAPFVDSFVRADPTALNTIIHHSQHTLTQYLAEGDAPRSGRNAHETAAAVTRVDLEHPIGTFDAALAELCELWLDHAVWYHHPRYIAHLNCPITATAVGADLLATTVNTAVESWDQASSAAAIEGHLLEFFARKLRWPEDPHSRTRGVFTSGGTQSNLQALYIAREKALGAQGVQGLSQLRLYTSSHAHYSVLRAAHLLGLADTAVITIESDAEHRLDAADLARRIAADVADGYTPMAVVATAGATDRGTIDPLESIAKVCRHAGVHLHVDAAYGGILLLSPTQRHRLRGMDAADSVTVDFHKGYFQPVACSAILLRDPADCALVSWHADYLNPEDATDHNLADFSLQTTRRFDALKLWMTLRTHGADALGEAFDACCAAARDAARRVDAHPRFALRATPELSTVLFTPADAPASLVHIVRQRLLEQGDVIVATTTFEGAPCWKFTILDPQLRGTDIDAILGLIEREMDAVDQANAQPSPSALAIQPAR